MFRQLAADSSVVQRGSGGQRIRWSRLGSGAYDKGVSDTTANAETSSLMDLIHGLVDEVRALRAELAASRAPSPWMTTEDAAQYLGVSRDTLDRLSSRYGHAEGGPVNVGEKRKTLRWHRDTLDEWFRGAGGIAAPKRRRCGSRGRPSSSR